MVCMRRVRCSCDARATRRARDPNPCVSRRAQTRTEETGPQNPPADSGPNSRTATLATLITLTIRSWGRSHCFNDYAVTGDITVKYIYIDVCMGINCTTF